MKCRIVDLRGKEVINISDGHRLGFPNDIELDALTGKLLAICVPKKFKVLNLFGKCEYHIIPWDCIKRIGEDIILVEYPKKDDHHHHHHHGKQSFA